MAVKVLCDRCGGEASVPISKLQDAAAGTLKVVCKECAEKQARVEATCHALISSCKEEVAKVVERHKAMVAEAFKAEYGA